MWRHWAIAAPWIIVLFCVLGAVSPAQAAERAPVRMVVAATHDAHNAPVHIGELWKRTELFFGTSKPDGTVVTADELNQFVDNEITPRFPDGLTALTGYGQGRNSAGVIIQEQSVVLILLYPLSDRDASKRIEEIRMAYKAAFQQESVLRVDGYARVSF
ncbi:MAG: DUF3574 domain-containing protein [Anaerolineae bacterium]|nr:DUF3574 domain-containing protein [Anaerolineae bacterium]